MSHQCQAVVVTCIDFRFQEYIQKYLAENFPSKSFDRVAWAGGVKDLSAILGQIEISHRLHHISWVVLINHEDCGAYGQEGTAEVHKRDLKNAAAKILGQYPNLAVDKYYLHLDGNLEKI